MADTIPSGCCEVKFAGVLRSTWSHLSWSLPHSLASSF